MDIVETALDEVLSKYASEERKAYRKGQKVRVQNRYAVMEYNSLEEAAYWLSKIGVLTEEEIKKKLSGREAYINGYSVTYPED